MSSLIWIYRFLFSPTLHLLCGPGFGCRFQPTCSHYFSEAIKTHGLRHGTVLGLRRISRCHPWGGLGFDPVPARAFKQTSGEVRG